MLRDAEYFKSKIGSIDGAGDAGDHLISLIKDKNVPRPKVAPTPTPEPNRASAEEVRANGKPSSEAADAGAANTRSSKDEMSDEMKHGEAENAS